MAEVKQPKPFLKRGTRQFLSNATVRSLNQKPNIVDFGADEDAPEPKTAITNHSRNDSQEIKVEIKVNNKPKPKKETETKTTNAIAKENKNLNQDKSNSQTIAQNKKKATMLDDYITPKDNKRENAPKEKPMPNRPSLYQPKISMAAALKRQEEHLSDSDDEEAAPQENKRVIRPPMPKNQPCQTVSNAKKKVINIDLEEQPEKINFNSDSEEEAPSKPKPKPQVFPKPVEKKSRWEDDEEEKIVPEQPKGPSKILQKFYKKQPEAPASKPNLEKKLTPADIPRDLKEQIFNELLAEKHSDFTKKLDELHNSIMKSKKQRETLEEGTKQLGKEREQFEREMERKRKEFEEKVAAENNKLTREKRYLKDQQTTGKPDWRTKNEVEELRTKLEQAEAEKKKLKAAHTQEAERLKKKLEEQEAETEQLKGQIRCIEMEKIELKAKAKAEKKEVSRGVGEIARYWQDAPTRSYVSNFFEDNFTLISLDPHYYHYESLEYYIYYCSKKDEMVELVGEERDSNGAKIARRYRNGKEEIEYISKLIKEIFPAPFKFTVVHHLNGDIKMILPEGVHLYFDKKNQITEWKISPDKVIYNFHRLGQVEMKFKHRRGEVHEFYKGDQLTRKEGSDTTYYRRTPNGDIVREGREY